MSHLLIDRSPDLKRLRDEGFSVDIRSNYLIVADVPYLNGRKEIGRARLVSDLSLSGDRTATPGTHIVYFDGEHPCHMDGKEIEQIRHETGEKKLDEGLVVARSFSNKPENGYKDYYEKMMTYIAIIGNPARAIDPSVTAQTFRPVENHDENSPFNYLDTASSRADIVAVTRKLELEKVAIVGLGGTGSYVLDLVAKTPVREIHTFDGDALLQHNAYRAPGAPSREELDSAPLKVDYFKSRYANMHRGIIAHGYHIDGSNVHELKEMDFVFICIDGGSVKKEIIEKLEEFDIPFVDTGMGVNIVDESLLGIVRLTTSTAQKRDHVQKGRIAFAGGDDNNEYSRNIQIADLNALNAVLAVIKWKKIFGFYKDLENEHHSTYTIDGNMLHNEDTP